MKYLIIAMLFMGSTSSAQSLFGANASGSSGSGSKDTTRWTLTDYLSQKQKVRLMDHWLGLNGSAVKFESIISGGGLQYNTTSTNGSGVRVKSNESVTSGRFSLFYTIFGLEGEYEKSNKDWNSTVGMFSIRLLGSSQQNTNLTASYGIRKKAYTGDTPETFQNQFAQASLNIYIVNFFGIDGSYRSYFNNKSSLDRDFKGTRVTGGVFFEIGFLRIYGQFNQEQSEITPADGSAATKEDRQGFDVGAKIFL